MEDICELAATYRLAVASKLPFADRNKRATFLAAGLFLRQNSRRLVADAARMVLALAAGQRDIETLATWIRARSIADELWERRTGRC